MKVQTEGQSEHGETRKKFQNKFDRINIFIGGNEEQIWHCRKTWNGDCVNRVFLGLATELHLKLAK